MVTFFAAVPTPLSMAVALLASIGAHAAIDLVLRRATNDAKASWYLLHSASNACITLASVDSVIACIVDPENAINAHKYLPAWLGPGSKLPLLCVNALHIYHILAYDLTPADKFHHLMFLPFLGVPGVMYDWGFLCNVLAFFVCGVPGAIDYYILGMQRLGWHLHINQPCAAARLNSWLRMPGVLVCMGICYPSVLAGRYSVPFAPLIVQYLLMPLNAIMYQVSTVRRAARKECEARSSE